MRKFEIGKRYTDGAMTIEVLKRTAKRVTVAIIAHAGRFNEKVIDEKSVKVNDWKTEEVIFIGCREYHA